MSKASQDHDGEIFRDWNTQTLDRQLGSQHGTDLGSALLGDNCIPWSLVGHLAVGPELVPVA